ncbi:MAG: XdhC family protein [Cyclobacteriaceae bacterium]
MRGFWSKISEWLSDNQKVVLLVVIDSQGSSPGRQGFKMAVNEKHELTGSIGGGIMEHKLIELCKENLLKKNFDPFLKKQIHQTNIPKDKSGMICSGEQTIAFYALNPSHQQLIGKIAESSNGIISFSDKKLDFKSSSSQVSRFYFKSEAKSWLLREALNHFPILHIIGGGHVGLALSRLAHELSFEIMIYDDRKNLNTVEENKWAHTIHVTDYSQIGDLIPGGTEHFVVLMSFGYQTDKIILSNLIERDFQYLGMMGSREKVKKLFEEMEQEGISKEQLKRVHAPIGIPISSKTPEEIAVSILAQIIQVKNTN